MQGSLRQLGTKRWQLRVYLGVDPATGKKRQLGRVFHGGRRAAEDALRDLIAEVEADRAKPSKRMTVAELLELHIAERTAGWSPNTLRDRRRITDREIVPALGDRDIRTVRPLDVERLVRTIAETRPPTARNTLAVLRAAYADALRWDLVDRNPARDARPPKVRSRAATSPEVAAVRSMLAALEDDPAFALVVRVVSVTGLRRGELAALRWSDVDLDGQRLVVSRSIISVDGKPVEKSTKTDAVKRLHLDAGTVAALRSWRVASMELALEYGCGWSDDRFVWARRPDGLEPWGLGTFSHRWRQLADQHGLTGVRLHDMRHAMVSQLIGDGFDVAVASERAGHRSRSTTLNFYTHALPDRGVDAGDHLGRILDQPSDA